MRGAAEKYVLSMRKVMVMRLLLSENWQRRQRFALSCPHDEQAKSIRTGACVPRLSMRFLFGFFFSSFRLVPLTRQKLAAEFDEWFFHFSTAVHSWARRGIEKCHGLTDKDVSEQRETKLGSKNDGPTAHIAGCGGFAIDESRLFT